MPVVIRKRFRRRQNPAARTTHGNIAAGKKVVLQKHKFAFCGLLHFFQRSPPVIVVAAQNYFLPLQGGNAV